MIVLDTHAWIWWHAETRGLSRRARSAIDAAEAIAIAAISTWELAMLVARGRLTLDREPLVWVRQALAQPRCVLLPLTPEIACRSVTLDVPGDPADRLILATALDHRAAVITKDQRLRRQEVVDAIW